MVTTNGPANTMWDSLFRTMGTDNAEVGDMVAMGNGRDGDKNMVLVPGMASIPCARW